ncbi:PDZ and LIM domain protein 5 isoform X3 [Pezoporus flaviventris]|uniref:PDZ and LIM domain protein 5 isoform X3 n=1 Tax=Pezoporus flaviventris TaxID=889875 RepID=UPI002AB1D60F|nr:PDZ and LIM domain protein 5 isoform X3 [Pezoporus flaviventris]
MSNYSVSLVGPAPWGFRLQGGKDFNVPLSISRLNDGGKAARAHVGIGDVVLTIDGISTDGMTHLEAQNKIKACTGNLNMTLQRVSSVQKPDIVQVPKGEPKEVVKPVPIASAVAPKVTPTASVAYNKTPRPFGAVTSSKITSIPSPSSAFTPAQAAAAPAPFAVPGLHVNSKPNAEQCSPVLSAAKPAVNVPRQPATHNAGPSASAGDGTQDVAEGQRRGFRENQGESKQQNGPPRKHIVDTYTEFYHTPTHSDASKKRLIEDTEDWHPRTGTTQSRSFRILAQITGTDHMKEPEHEASKKTKKSQTENGDFSENGARPEPAATLLPLAESFSGNVCSSSLSEHIAAATPGREITVEFPALEAASFLTPDKAPLPAKCTVATQTSELPVPTTVAVGLPLAAPTMETALELPSAIARHEASLLTCETNSFSKISSYQSKSSVNHTSDSVEAAQPAAFTASSSANMLAHQENMDTRSATASTASAAGLKPTGAPGAAKYSGLQPASQAASASGWTSNSVKPPGTAAPSEKPAPAPPLNEQDTLVQRAEHIPAGKRTPMCAHCNQVIRGPFLVALGKSWHPEEFNCAHCKTSMAYIGFVEEKGMLYCEVCYEKFFAPECSKCQRKILGEVINALKQTWHVSCFVCVACHNPIRNNVFHLEDGDPYCETDYYALFGTMCHGCEFPIEAGDRFLEALGHTWHDTCFVCSVCNDSLEGQTFFSKKDKPLCKKHAHSINI